MGFLLVLRAELARNFIVVRRYWFATLIGLFIGYSMLITVAYAFVTRREDVAQSLSGQFGSETAINGTLGVLIGMLAFGIVGMFTNGLQSMARSGELEQLYMSPHGLITNFIARSLVASISNVLSMAILLWLVDMTLGGMLHIDRADLWILIGLLALTYFNLIGFGFMMGGMVLIFKQIGPAASVVRLILIGMAVGAQHENLAFGLGDEGWPPLVKVLSHILPITDAAVCLKLVVIKDVGMSLFSPPYVQHVFFLILNGAVWSLLGLMCFRLMERWSRSKGTLGAY